MILKILSLLCILAALGLFGFEYLFTSKTNEAIPDVKNEMNSGDKINYRLQSIEQKIKMQRLKAMQGHENDIITQPLQGEERNYKVKMIKGIDDRLDNTLQDVISDLTPQNKEESFKKLEDEIQEGVESLEDLESYNEYERATFIEAFIKNAKARGLNIKIDKDLNVYE